MCGRYSLHTPPIKLTQLFDLAETVEFAPRYNIAPGTEVAVVQSADEGRRVLRLLHWGLVPRWAKDPSIGNRMINARAETVTVKPSFRDAFQSRRCLLPANGFFEWKSEGGGRRPYYICSTATPLLAFGGLWESWGKPDGGHLQTVCIITTTPNALLAAIHDRMPVIVPERHWTTWLTGTGEEAHALMVPYPEGELTAWPVSRRVNRPGGDDPGIIEREIES